MYLPAVLVVRKELEPADQLRRGVSASVLTGSAGMAHRKDGVLKQARMVSSS
jgi:hypothetical protein